MALPGLFCALLCKHTPVVKETLGILGLFWTTLQAVEAAKLVDPWFDGLHTNLYWAHMTWVREVLVGLAEYSFKAIPTWITASIEAYAGRFTQTKVCEDAFKLLRHKERFSGKNDVARKQRWHATFTSGILEDHGTEPLQPLQGS
eukprot:3267357-Amphidinium_carterae.3